MRNLALLQARVDSSRLPGKVLMPILDKPMILHQIERIRNCQKIDKLIVATSSEASDDGLAKTCRGAGIECYRGSLKDVLNRFVQAALPHRPEAVIRLTGDCPLADPVVIDQVIAFFEEGGYDYASNCVPPTFPDGLDVEVMRFECLQEADREASLPSQREHVTPFLRQNPERYRQGTYIAARDLSHLRWTVDEPEDFEFVRRVYEGLYPKNPRFTTHDILELLQEEPGLVTINSKFKRNEGTKKSLEEDVRRLKEK